MCNSLSHHCTVHTAGVTRLGARAAAHNLGWVVLEMTARSPEASNCKPRRAGNCEVLAVEVQKGQVMYLAALMDRVPEPKGMARDTTEAARSLQVVDNIHDGTGRDSERKVVYSIRLAHKADIDQLRADQLEVAALLRVSSELEHYAPLVTSYMVLSSSTTGTKGRYLESDSYNHARTGNAGENCSGKCAYLRGSVATTIQPCDIKAGRRFVNLVAGAARDSASGGGRVVAIRDGGMRVARYYESEYSAPSAARSC